ncbi:MAG: cupin domain-containing protein, partial [Deltaproteobacteria bacterium]|nr:cupin domain-containing protein [Deltaproteobacteria bacterium]
LGRGFLEIGVFRRILAENPWISDVELSNWGEIFLNENLVEILKYAHSHEVSLHAGNGANLNDVDDDVLEALVEYGLRSMTCSIDGACRETYSKYRVNGNFDKVISNIKKINEFKAKHDSEYPNLCWQFIAFGHNEHEIDKARKLAEDLNMGFNVKLSWMDLYTDVIFPVKNLSLIRMETGLGVADREEYRNKYRKEYARDCCHDLWKSPQINYDGRLLGCSVNYWDDYGNVLTDGLTNCVNGGKMMYARDMLLGKKESKDEIPCSKCKFYKRMKENNTWISEREIDGKCCRIHSFDLLGNNPQGYKIKKQLVRVSSAVKRRLRRDYFRTAATGTEPPARLASRIHPLRIPLKVEDGQGWTPCHLFKGSAKGIRNLSCHASALIKDHCPHDPHMHKEEELLLLLSGEAELILQDGQTADENRRRRLKAGHFAYYPSNFAHTLRTTSDAPANYLMFKWHNDPGKTGSELAFGVFTMDDAAENPGETGGFRTRYVFEGPTSCLKKLHCHSSLLLPGAGYAPHVDSHNTVVIVLEGTVETLGERVGPHGVIYFAAGEPHGMRNPTEETARYIVFEFHGR